MADRTAEPCRSSGITWCERPPRERQASIGKTYSDPARHLNANRLLLWRRRVCAGFTIKSSALNLTAHQRVTKPLPSIRFDLSQATTVTMPKLPNKLDRSAFIPNYPTHAHPPELWEELGRTIATFGFLEDVLVKAYFAITATTSYEWQTEEEAKEAVEKWGEQLALAMADTLASLAQKYAAAVRRNKSASFAGIDGLEASIKKAAERRKALCHGFWGKPHASGGSGLSYFRMPGKKVANLQKFDTRIDIAWLRTSVATGRSCSESVFRGRIKAGGRDRKLLPPQRRTGTPDP
jgi:hypothetical protein